jgi:hypothetical protein
MLRSLREQRFQALWKLINDVLALLVAVIQPVANFSGCAEAANTDIPGPQGANAHTGRRDGFSGTATRHGGWDLLYPLHPWPADQAGAAA